MSGDGEKEDVDGSTDRDKTFCFRWEPMVPVTRVPAFFRFYFFYFWVGVHFFNDDLKKSGMNQTISSKLGQYIPGSDP